MKAASPHRASNTFREGFSLVELLVSMFIFGTLLVLIIANFHRGGLTNDLRRSAQELTAHLRRVQNLSTVGQALNVGGVPLVPAGGYGVAVNWVVAGTSNTYIVYADVRDNACLLHTSSKGADSVYTPTCDQIVEAGTVTLRPSVFVDKITVGGLDVPPNPGPTPPFVSIGFKPPKPTPFFEGVLGSTIEIQLTHTQTSDRRTITIIGASGQISERIGGI